MKGVFTMDKRLKDVDQVTVINGINSIEFKRNGGMWDNHIKKEKISDDDMGKLLSCYEEFGWGTIWHEEDLHTNNVDLAGFLMIPNEARSVVVEYSDGKKVAFLNNGIRELLNGRSDIVFSTASGMMMTITAMRSSFPVLIEKGIYKSVTCYGPNQQQLSQSDSYKK